MNLSKRKYKRAEVEDIVKRLTDDYEERLKAQKNRISSLLSENMRLTSELGSYEDKERLLVSTLRDAEEKAEELAENSRLRYSLVIEKLKNFSARWEKYFAYIEKKYPFSPESEKAVDLFAKIKNILSGDDVSDTFEKAETLLGEAERTHNGAPFNPKAKIEAYIASTEKGGFNMDEVLNPGELKLEDLCKELGLTEED